MLVKFFGCELACEHANCCYLYLLMVNINLLFLLLS